MFDFLLDADRFVPRGRCGEWNDGFKTLYVFSEAIIAMAYVVIPAPILIAKGKTWQPLASRDSVRVLFAAFILLCGVTHLEGVLSFVWPAYHVFAILRAVTAVVSWITIFALFWRESP